MLSAVQQQPQPQGRQLTSQAVIKERLKFAKEAAENKQKVYLLRQVAANFLDISSPGAISKGGETYPDFIVRDYEEARHNPAAVNTQIQAKSLVFNEPDIVWRHVRDGVAMVREAWYLKRYREQKLASAHQWQLLDALIGGEGNMFSGTRNGQVFMEWADSLHVYWDTAFKEHHKRRFVYVEKPIPAGEALQLYPKLADKVRLGRDGEGSEKIIVITCYWDVDGMTSAALFKDEFIDGPSINKYGRLPGTQMGLMHLPSVKYGSGQLEWQLGTLAQMLRYQRGFREIGNRASPFLMVSANASDEGVVEQVASGMPGMVVKIDGQGNAIWQNGPDIPKVQLEHYNMLVQQMNAESGTNDFQKGSTATKVDFATELNYIAQQSGVQGEYANQQFEMAIVEGIRLIMDIGKRFAPDEELIVEGVPIPFSAEAPLRVLLGSDGEISLKPGGMKYKSEAQRLNEVGLLAQTLAAGAALPEPLQIKFTKMVLGAADVEDADAWISELEQYVAMRAQQERAIAVQGQAVRAQGGGPPQGQVQASAAAM